VPPCLFLTPWSVHYYKDTGKADQAPENIKSIRAILSIFQPQRIDKTTRHF
jgi:hypothetical protein